MRRNNFHGSFAGKRGPQFSESVEEDNYFIYNGITDFHT